MIYYVYLTLASLLFGAQFMTVKGYERTGGKGIFASARFSALSGLAAFLIFAAVSGFRFEFSLFSLGMAALLAVVSVSCSMVGMRAISMGDIAVYSLFMMLGGMLLPFAVGVIFLKEKISAFQIAGVVLLIAALILPVFGKNKQKGTPLFYLLCMGLFLLNGMSSVLSKLHQIDVRAVPSSQFTALFYAAQFLLSGAVWLGGCLFGKKKDLPKLTGKATLNALAFAGCNGAATFLQVYSAIYVKATAQFPIITGGTLVFSALLGFLIYREKLSPVRLVQIAVALCATVLFMF